MNLTLFKKINISSQYKILEDLGKRLVDFLEEDIQAIQMKIVILIDLH
jgi:hypothetical protein